MAEDEVLMDAPIVLSSTLNVTNEQLNQRLNFLPIALGLKAIVFLDELFLREGLQFTLV